MSDPARAEGGALAALRDTIVTALDMVVSLDDDSLLRRWMVTYQHTPSEDRLGLVQILEREVPGSPAEPRHGTAGR